MTRVLAASVRGPAHARAGLPCQDAWSAVAGAGPSLAVVCDGMGSRPRAREGARAATLASRDAWRLWRRSGTAGADEFVRLLEVCWRLRLGAISPDQAATTCLVYAEDPHGRAVVAQLGDGLVARGTGGKVRVHGAAEHAAPESGPESELGFTQALGTPHGLSDWRLTLGPPLAPGDWILLATDGVSGDLHVAKLGELVDWILAAIAPHRNAHRRLRSELCNWPVPHHGDDKTILVMWKPCSPTNA